MTQEGWVKKFTVGEPQLSDYAKLYESLGYEVLLEPFSPDQNSEECKACYLTDCHKYKTIYTRSVKT